MIPFCGYYICWYANLWDISFTKDVDWDQLLLCIEPHSCLMHQYLLDNSSDRVLCTTYIRGSSGHSRKLSSETVITDKFTAIHLCRVCCRIPTHLGPLAVAFLFRGNSIICTHLTNFLSYVLTGFEGEQTSSVRFMEWRAFSVLDESLLPSNMN